MDIYQEYMIRQKRTLPVKSGVILLWGLAIAFTPMSVVLSVLTEGLSVPFCAALYVLAWWVTSNTNVEYEYIFTNGELDVDKISGKRKRKRYVTVPVAKFDVCEKAEGENFLKYWQNPAIKVKFDASKGSGTSGRYYAVFNNKSGERMVMLFSPPEALLEHIKLYNRTVMSE